MRNITPQLIPITIGRVFYDDSFVLIDDGGSYTTIGAATVSG
jgi:hypothetical protein